MSVCWNSDPQGRAKFADLEQQLSNMLEQEAVYLSLRRSLSWKTRGETPKKAAMAKAPILQSVEKRVMGGAEMDEAEESAENDEAEVSGVELKRSDEAHKRDSAV